MYRTCFKTISMLKTRVILRFAEGSGLRFFALLRMARSFALLFFLLTGSQVSQGKQIDFTAGASANGVDELGKEKGQYGSSFRARYLNYRYGSTPRHGWTFGGTMRTIWSTDLWLGWGAMFGDQAYFEVAGGAAYGFIAGPGYFVLGGVGLRLSSKVSVSVPFVIRANHYWEALPHIGYRF